MLIVIISIQQQSVTHNSKRVDIYSSISSLFTTVNIRNIDTVCWCKVLHSPKHGECIVKHVLYFYPYVSYLWNLVIQHTSIAKYVFCAVSILIISEGRKSNRDQTNLNRKYMKSSR